MCVAIVLLGLAGRVMGKHTVGVALAERFDDKVNFPRPAVVNLP